MPRTRSAPPPLPSEAEAAQALAHPIRAAAFEILGQRVASPKELTEEIGEPLGTISYHVRQLLDLHCIELVDTQPRRGAIEHYYRATAKATITVEPVQSS